MGISRTILTSSLALEESVSYGKQYERKRLDGSLLGITKVPGKPYSTVVVDTNLTGTTNPSWTRASIGYNQAFVVQVLSASNHESQVLNYFRSGTQAVEESAVPASATLYYSKGSKYRTVMVKKTASYLDVGPTTDGKWRPVQFVEGKGVNCSFVTGVAGQSISSRRDIPAVIDIPVNYSGKIADVKVWIELTQVSGTARKFALGNLGIALRSPNLHWGHSHPIRNDPDLKRVFSSELTSFTNQSNPAQGSFFGPNRIADFYQDTFILWEGSDLSFAGPWGTNASQQTLQFYPCFQRDRSIRTIFTDGSSTPNPRHNAFSGMSASYVGAPNASFGINDAWGMDVPWTSETEISGANARAAAGSPPRGWLTGPGGTNSVNEWPTTGSNYGAETIRPLYPLLEPLYQRKVYGNDLALRNVSSDPSSQLGQALFKPENWVGFRPGLRGTEISGTWQLLVYDNAQSQHIDFPTFFRQIRLEFIVYDGIVPNHSVRKLAALNPRRRRGEWLLCRMSGSDGVYVDGGFMTGSWEAHVSETYVLLEESNNLAEIGRTFGVQLNSGSFDPSDAALIYRVTGTLADISGSAPGWLLNNRFGMPQIPESSASLVPYVEYVTPEVGSAQDLISPEKVLDSPQRLADLANVVNPPKTLVQLATDLSAENDDDGST